MTRRLLLTLIVCVAALTLPAAAIADVQAIYHGGTYFGSVVVEPGQVVEGDLDGNFRRCDNCRHRRRRRERHWWCLRPAARWSRNRTDQSNRRGRYPSDGPLGAERIGLQSLDARPPPPLAAIVESAGTARLLDLPASHAHGARPAGRPSWAKRDRWRTRVRRRDSARRASRDHDPAHPADCARISSFCLRQSFSGPRRSHC